MRGSSYPGGVGDAKESERRAAGWEPMSVGDTFFWGHSLGLSGWHCHSWQLDFGRKKVKRNAALVGGSETKRTWCSR